MPRRLDAIVLGAGAAGLAAAEVLSREGLSLVVLEARRRIGGRIRTVRLRGLPVPLELGAEFVHGREEELFALAREASIADRAPARGAPGDRRRPHADPPRLLDPLRGDRAPLEELGARPLRRRTSSARSGGMPLRDRELLASIVEGYDAADLERASEHALSMRGEPREDPGERAPVSRRLGLRPRAALAGEPAASRARARAARRRRRPRPVAARRGRGVDLRRAKPCARVARSSPCPPACSRRAPARGAPSRSSRTPAPVRRALSGIAMGDVCRLALVFDEPFWSETGRPRAPRAPREPSARASRRSCTCPGTQLPTWWSAAPGPGAARGRVGRRLGGAAAAGVAARGARPARASRSSRNLEARSLAAPAGGSSTGGCTTGARTRSRAARTATRSWAGRRPRTR
jgi:hypothetical protein